VRSATDVDAGGPCGGGGGLGCGSVDISPPVRRVLRRLGFRAWVSGPAAVLCALRKPLRKTSGEYQHCVWHSYPALARLDLQKPLPRRAHRTRKATARLVPAPGSPLRSVTARIPPPRPSRRAHLHVSSR